MPVHHLHDGPPLRDVYLRPRQPALPKKAVPAATLAALQWAAERAGQSYGRFILNLSTAEQQRIQGDFEAFQAEKKRKKGERQAARQAERPRVDIDTGEAGFVISDDDI